MKAEPIPHPIRVKLDVLAPLFMLDEHENDRSLNIKINIF